MSVFVDLDASPDGLRQAIYAGNLVVLTRLRAVSDFVAHTRQQLLELFRPHDPERAHEHFDQAEMARMLAAWKPGFVHSSTSKKLVCAMIKEAGFPAESTLYDMLELRASFPVGHQAAGAAFLFPWHRDTWYSAPAQQVNWWLPVFPVRDGRAMVFDLRSFGREVSNDSGTFDYYENNISRLTASQLTRERHVRLGALNHRPGHDLAVLPAPGAVLLFSGAQLHKLIPNASGRSRFSVDFRTVDATDLLAGRGAPMVDVRCTGTAIRNFRNVADQSSFDEETVRRLLGGPPDGAGLVFG